jgi:ribonuclease H2 subunit B
LHDADAAALAQAGTNGAKPGKKGKDANAEKEEKGKKRKNTTHGVEQLKKANITGMKKLSSFFAAKG